LLADACHDGNRVALNSSSDFEQTVGAGIGKECPDPCRRQYLRKRGTGVLGGDAPDIGSFRIAMVQRPGVSSSILLVLAGCRMKEFKEPAVSA